MLRLVSDENFNGDIVRGLLLRHPALDLRRVQDVGLEEADDPTILAWAATNNRIVLTHDHATMPDFAYDRVVAGHLWIPCLRDSARVWSTLDYTRGPRAQRRFAIVRASPP